MTLRRRRIIGLVVALCVLATVGACGGDDGTNAPAENVADLVKEEGRLTVGTSLGSRPFEFVKAGEPAGFDIELMAEIAQRLDLEPEYVDVGFRKLFDQLSSGTIDAAISAIAITRKRQGSAAFTDPYFVVTAALVAKPGAGFRSIDDLGERIVAVAGEPSTLKFANATFPPAVTIIEFPSAEAAFVATESGQAAAAFSDMPAAVKHLAAESALEIVADVPTDEEYGIAVAPDNGALAEAFNAQLAAIVEDGTYAALYEKWFTGPVPAQFR